LNALTSFFAPQTLKLIGYIKNQKVIIIIDSGRTHNFIHQCISQETHCYIHEIKKIQSHTLNILRNEDLFQGYLPKIGRQIIGFVYLSDYFGIIREPWEFQYNPFHHDLQLP